MLRKPRLCFALFALFVVAWFGHFWLRKGPGSGELFLSLAKAADFERGCLSVHGLVWWTPNYLQGQSWAGFWSTALTLAALEAGRFLLWPFGVSGFTAYKVVGLLAWAGAGSALFSFALEFTGSVWTAAAAGAFYLLCPEATALLGGAEHMAFGGAALCFAFPPLVCRALLRAQQEKRGAVLTLAFSLGAFFLAATKMAVLSLPLFGIYALWLRHDLREPSDRFHFDCRVVQGGLLAFLLGCVPLLPLVREEQWMTLFSTDPLLFWQGAFTLKSGLSFFDRNAALLSHTPDLLHHSASTFYIGIFWGVALIGAFLEIGPWRGWLATPSGRLCRLFTGLALFFAWLSYGIFSPWQTHRQILLSSTLFPDWGLPLLWLGLLAQAAAVFRIASFWTPRWWVQGLLAAGFVFVSGYGWLSHLPPFGQVRAPAAFWAINGSFCVALAGALALAGGMEAARLRPWGRGAALAVLIALTWIDFAPYQAPFKEGALAPQIYPDFLDAAAFLRARKEPGYIEPISGRYFYLQLPQLSGHPLAYEAATSYFQPRWMRPAQNLARQDSSAHNDFLDAGGVRFIFIDKTDPDAPPALVTYLRSVFPAAYENRSFLILENGRCIAPALTSGRVVPPSDDTSLAEMLAATRQDIWITHPGVLPGAPPVPIPPAQDPGESRLLMPLAQPRAHDYQTIAVRFTGAGKPWVIVPESYHPDWQAECDGEPVPVYRALGFLLAAKVTRDTAGLIFHFRPPWWYNGCLALAGMAWLLCGWAWLRRRF